MYHLQLKKGTDPYNFLKFTTNFFFTIFSESETESPKSVTDLINTLKVQMDLHEGDETLQLHFDLPVLEHLSRLIDLLAKIHLNKEEYFEAVALKTEQTTDIQIWNKYLQEADLYFKDLKQFIHEDEWKVIEKALSADTRISIN